MKVGRVYIHIYTYIHIYLYIPIEGIFGLYK